MGAHDWRYTEGKLKFAEDGFDSIKDHCLGHHGLLKDGGSLCWTNLSGKHLQLLPAVKRAYEDLIRKYCEFSTTSSLGAHLSSSQTVSKRKTYLANAHARMHE